MLQLWVQNLKKYIVIIQIEQDRLLGSCPLSLSKKGVDHLYRSFPASDSVICESRAQLLHWPFWDKKPQKAQSPNQRSMTPAVITLHAVTCWWPGVGSKSPWGQRCPWKELSLPLLITVITTIHNELFCPFHRVNSLIHTTNKKCQLPEEAAFLVNWLLVCMAIRPKSYWELQNFIADSGHFMFKGI